MGTGFLLDTNTVIYLHNGSLPTATMTFLNTLLKIECNISVISKIELLGWQTPVYADYVTLARFVAQADVLPLTDAIVNKTIFFKKDYKVKLPDAIIAATAVEHHLTLISRNDKDFQRLPGLKYMNPFSDF
jgi:predicted nucleic acid-binding protein